MVTNLILTIGGYEVHVLNNDINFFSTWANIIKASAVGKKCDSSLPQNNKAFLQGNRIERKTFSEFDANVLLWALG